MAEYSTLPVVKHRDDDNAAADDDAIGSASQAALFARHFDTIAHVAAMYADDFNWHVLPAAVGEKRPIVLWSMQHAPEPLSGYEMYHYWQADPRYNIAVLTGVRSRLLVLDLDENPAKYTLSVDERLALLSEHGWSVDTCADRSGGGGLHLFYALPAGVQVRSVDAYLTSGIELKAEGRLVIVAPSRTQKGDYRWLAWRDPWTTPLASVPDVALANRHHAQRFTAPNEVNEASAQSAPAGETRTLSAHDQRARSQAARTLAKRAIARAHADRDGGRHNSGLWLACQLRDLRVSDAIGYRAMLAYQRAVEWLEV